LQEVWKKYYDKTGNMTKIEIYGAQENLESFTTYTYDKNEYCLKVEYRDSNGKLEKVSKMLYKNMPPDKLRNLKEVTP
jgi:hypothetical protein